MVGPCPSLREGSVMSEHELVDAVINGIRRAQLVVGDVFAAAT